MHEVNTDPRPVPKVTAAGLGGAIATLVVWAVQTFTGVEVPTGVEGAVATVVAFAAGYLR